MGYESTMGLSLMVLSFFPLLFLTSLVDDDPVQPLPVPECRQRDTYHGVSDSGHATMQLLLDRNWTSVYRIEHFWTDDIYARCERSPSDEQPNFTFLCKATEATTNYYARATATCQEPEREP